MWLNQLGIPTIHERREEAGSSIQGLPRLWTPLYLAEEVGEGLG